MVTSTLKIKATPKEIWEALTEKSKQKVWYFDIPDFTTEVGKTFEFYESEAKEFLHRCEVLDCVEEKLFQHTWSHPNESSGTSTVTWTIESAAGDETCTVKLSHRGLESFADAGEKFHPENYQMGWDAILKTNLRNFLVGIDRLKFEIEINANAQTIWKNMWGKEAYKVWTAPFCEGSYYTGELVKDSRIHFLAPDGSGMYSDVFFIKEPYNIVFKHIGEVKNFQEQPLDGSALQWTGCFEMYHIREIESGKHKLTAEVDCTKEHITYMSEKFPLGMQKIKETSEK